MTTLHEAAQQALPTALEKALSKCQDEAIKSGAHESYKAVRDAFTELRSALAQQGEQQPVALQRVKVTEAMHVAAVKVLRRATGLDGLPQRMLDAMLAAAPAPHPDPRTVVQQMAGALRIVRGKHGCGALTLPEADVERVDVALAAGQQWLEENK